MQALKSLRELNSDPGPDKTEMLHSLGIRSAESSRPVTPRKQRMPQASKAIARTPVKRAAASKSPRPLKSSVSAERIATEHYAIRPPVVAYEKPYVPNLDMKEVELDSEPIS